MDYEQLSPAVRSIVEAVAAEEGFIRPGFMVAAGSKPGDNYMGVVYRVQVREKDDSGRKSAISLIVKCQPENETLKERFKTPELFQNEAAFYNDVIPALVNFQKEKGITASDMSPTHVRCLRAGEMIVMEDQLPLGFTMIDRIEPVELSHCLLVMRELGRFHSLSFALREQRPDIFQRLTTAIREIVIVENIHPAMKEWFPFNLNKALEKFVEHSQVENKTKYVEAIERFGGDGYYPRIMEMVNPANIEPYAVINHGDCWTNNLLFKYTQDGKEPEKVCFLDFQLARLASPACDIAHFLFCCTDKATRDAHYQHLLREYHSSLATHLARLGSDTNKLFPFEALQDQMRRCGRFGLTQSVGLLPMFTCKTDEIPDINEASKMNDVDFAKGFDVVHSNDKLCWERICGIIVDVVDMGYIE